mgnify:CR=1 FL=1
MKKALSMLLAGTMAMSLVACSSGNSGSSTTADTTAAAAADTKAEGGDTAAAGASEDYGDYNWNLAMTVSETTTNYKMVEYFANLVKEKTNGSINIELHVPEERAASIRTGIVEGRKCLLVPIEDDEEACVNGKNLPL